MRRWLFAGTVAVIVIAAVLSGCAPSNPAPQGFRLTSSNFKDGGIISKKYTCEGENISPPLSWGQVPAGTQSLALIMEDLDAPKGVFTHWVIFNLPPGSPGLAEAIPGQSELADGARQGRNDFGKTGYGGPCPSDTPFHRYQFTLYALDRPLDLAGGASRQEVEAAMSGHILGQARLIGTYQHFCCNVS
jgi:Raf kinase inhibitor-like YbhB/YbcL family protein